MMPDDATCDQVCRALTWLSPSLVAKLFNGRRPGVILDKEYEVTNAFTSFFLQVWIKLTLNCPGGEEKGGEGRAESRTRAVSQMCSGQFRGGIAGR